MRRVCAAAASARTGRAVACARGVQRMTGADRASATARLSPGPKAAAAIAPACGSVAQMVAIGSSGDATQGGSGRAAKARTTCAMAEPPREFVGGSKS